MVQFVECVDNNVAHSAVVALRNLAEDLQNKKTIGKYGMQAIVAKVKSHFKDIFQKKFLILNVSYCLDID